MPEQLENPVSAWHHPPPASQTKINTKPTPTSWSFDTAPSKAYALAQRATGQLGGFLLQASEQTVSTIAVYLATESPPVAPPPD
jgi:hypothetical protein